MTLRYAFTLFIAYVTDLHGCSPMCLLFLVTSTMVEKSNPPFNSNMTSSAPSSSLRPISMSDDELALELQRLANENNALEQQVANVCRTNQQLVGRVVHLQQVSEQEEEAIANNLLKKVDQVKREMRTHRQQIRLEEEYHNKLKEQIELVRTEQEHMENMLEQEQEFVLHKLQRELLETSVRKSEMEKALSEERRQYLELLHRQLLELAAHSSQSSAPPTPVAGSTMTATAVKSSSASFHNRTLSDTGVSDFVQHATSFAGAPQPSSILTATEYDFNISTSALGGGAGPGGVVSLSQRLQQNRTPDSPRCKSIADLELEINHLLLEQAEYQRKAHTQEQQCVELLGRLHDIQQQAFLDRARAVRLKEDLTKAKAELDTVQHSSVSTSLHFMRTTPCSSSEDQAGSCGTTPLHHLSLRDRTKELLSTPRLDLSGGHAGARLRGSSVASDHRSVSPSVASGYNSGVESYRGGEGFGTRVRGNSYRIERGGGGGAGGSRIASLGSPQAISATLPPLTGGAVDTPMAEMQECIASDS